MEENETFEEPQLYPGPDFAETGSASPGGGGGKQLRHHPHDTGGEKGAKWGNRQYFIAPLSSRASTKGLLQIRPSLGGAGRGGPMNSMAKKISHTNGRVIFYVFSDQVGPVHAWHSGQASGHKFQKVFWGQSTSIHGSKRVG